MPSRRFSFIDLVNQWMMTIALFLVCALLFWQLIPDLKEVKEKLESESKLNKLREAEHQQRQRTTDKTEQEILRFLQDHELWKKAQPAIQNQLGK